MTNFQVRQLAAVKLAAKSMKTRVDKTLRDYIDEAYSHVRLRRNCATGVRNALFAKILAELEASGDAMRCLDRKGRIAWKATPHLRSCLADQQADAEADAEEEAA